MKNTLFLLAFISASSIAYTVTAYHTGKSYITQSVTNQRIRMCEYRYGGNTFWQAHSGFSCPSSVRVQ